MSKPTSARRTLSRAFAEGEERKRAPCSCRRSGRRPRPSPSPSGRAPAAGGRAGARRQPGRTRLKDARCAAPPRPSPAAAPGRGARAVSCHVDAWPRERARQQGWGGLCEAGRKAGHRARQRASHISMGADSLWPGGAAAAARGARRRRSAAAPPRALRSGVAAVPCILTRGPEGSAGPTATRGADARLRRRRRRVFGRV